MPIYKAPQHIDERNMELPSVFLAGSIEMDKAERWQDDLQEKLMDKWNVFNPRRDNWNTDWKQEKENPQFNEQVSWELKALEQADVIIMYFAGNTKSPISLLEFGMYANSKKMMVLCDPDFWRKGNVDIVCERYEIPQYENFEALLNELLNTKKV